MEPQPSDSGEISLKEPVDIGIDPGEGSLAANGALIVQTGHRTSRHPLDRFIVKEPGCRDAINRGEVNRPFDPEQFDDLWKRVKTYPGERQNYVTELDVGANLEHYLPTRANIKNIHSDEINDALTTKLPLLNLTIPLALAGVDNAILNPRSTWSDHDAYDDAARGLARKFIKNFRKFNVDDDIIKAGPQLN